MLNKVEFQGRFVRDPEVKETQSGVKYCQFTVAWSEKYKENETKCFLRCTAWRATAEMIGKHFQKGKECIVEGRLQTDEYTDKDGNKKSSTVCAVDRIHFCGSKSESSSGTSQTTSTGQTADTSDNLDGFMNIPDGIDEELPFA